MTNEQTEPTYFMNEFTMMWTADLIHCPKCGSPNGTLQGLDKCTMCGTYRPGLIKIALPLTDDMIHPAVEHPSGPKMSEGICQCGEPYRKSKKSRIKLCPKCTHKHQQDTYRNKLRDNYGAYVTGSANEHNCVDCGLPIIPHVNHIVVGDQRYHRKCVPWSKKGAMTNGPGED